MTNPALSGREAVPATLAVPPPLPSITGSAIAESLRLLEVTRRALTGWLTRDF